MGVGFKGVLVVRPLRILLGKYTYAQMNVYMTCIHKCVCIHICMYIHVYTHTERFFMLPLPHGRGLATHSFQNPLIREHTVIHKGSVLLAEIGSVIKVLWTLWENVMGG